MTTIEKAEEFIKTKYFDHDHCSQSARAVIMFMEGVKWALQNAEEPVKFGPDIDGGAALFTKEEEAFLGTL